ncbi:MAG TPA: PEP-utilizing enzyme [Solirubrobacteraceae bacterium]|jgi:phosphohistidine swiveling domain-containing protein|nr:PEP-utilizing enzyme [Solirubrobacteraceae bacterium]
MGDGFERVGTGQTVFRQDEAVEGRLVWLDSPQAVMDFVAGGEVTESVVLARGGTTTFLTPALAAGVKGVITLQGSPESHLGIISREFGIPAIMGVAFERGVRSSRGEVIPADGVRVRVDVTTSPEGAVFVEEGAPVDDSPVPENPELDAMMAEFAVLLHHFNREIPHGAEGDAMVRGRMTTDVLRLTPESMKRDLTLEECNDFMDYLGWEFWDALALRATEGESGLIPRQEYEALGDVHLFERIPLHHRLLTAELGVDGLRELGATARREIGTKVNLLHLYCQALMPSFGRAVTVELGLRDRRTYGVDEIRRCVEITRRLYAGAWNDDGLIFTSARGYVAPILESHWLERFQDEKVSFADPEERARFQLFSATTEMFAFLQHLDNRLGLADTGPYPLPGGGFVIVRDHFVNEPLWRWARETAGDLPYAITEAMFFRDAPELTLRLLDVGTLFTEPANYLQYLTGAAVYVRDKWDTPVSEIRRIDAEEMESIRVRAEKATTDLYAKIASWSRREKIYAGAEVYYTGQIAVLGRNAGLWDRMVAEHRHYELDQLVHDAYELLDVQGKAATLVPQLFIAGGACARVGEEPSLQAAAELHRLALKGVLPDLGDAKQELLDRGLVSETKAGFVPTPAGVAADERELSDERLRVDVDQLAATYDRFLAVNSTLKSLATRWQDGGGDELAGEVEDVVERASAVLSRSAQILPRFSDHAERLRAACARVQDGEGEWMNSPTIDSVHTVWMEIHEDYLRTLGRDREAEGSY